MATCAADDGGGWGGCSYVQIEGLARIVSIAAPENDEYNCADAVKVTFDFAPQDPAAVNHYFMPAWSDKGQHLTVLAGANPPRGWVLLQGLAEGSEHECVRNEITKGTCTPVIFEFPKTDQEPEKVNCFAVGRYCVDDDGDGYDGVPNCGSSLDCNDNDSAILPGAPELPDGIDNDCDWLIDEDYTTTVSTSSTTTPAATTSTIPAVDTTTTTAAEPPAPETTTTTSIEEANCPLQQTLGEDAAELDALRAFRDQRLAQTPSGLFLITLYYAHSPEISAILAARPDLTAQTKGLVLEMLPAIQNAARAGLPLKLTDTQHQRLITLLLAVQRKASPRLASATAHILEKLASGGLLKGLM